MKKSSLIPRALVLLFLAGCSQATESDPVANDVNTRISVEASRISEIESTGDASKCSELTFEGFRKQCEANIEHEKKAKEKAPQQAITREPKPPRS